MEEIKKEELSFLHNQVTWFKSDPQILGQDHRDGTGRPGNVLGPDMSSPGWSQ